MTPNRDAGPRPGARLRRGIAALAAATSALIIAAPVAAADLPPATAAGWSVVIVNNYSPCNGPIGPGRCSGSAVVTTTGSTATANLPAVALGGSPYSAAITPDGSLALVVNVVDGTLSPIDLTSRPPRTLPAVTLGGSGDSFIAISPDGRLALVTDTGSANVYPVAITGHAFRVGRPIRAGNRPGGIAVSPDGTTAWVVVASNGTIRPIDLRGTAFTMGTAIPVGANPGLISISPDGATAYVTHSAARTVSAVPLVGGGAVESVAVGAAPGRPVITPDGSAMYVPNAGSGTITPFSLTGGAPVAGPPFALPHGTSDTAAFPNAAAISPDGRQLWVTDGGVLSGVAAPSGNTASVYDITTPMRPVLLRTILTGGFEVRGIAITPPIAAAGGGPSSLALSLPALGDVFLNTPTVLAGVAVAAGGVLFITFPAQIFNLTLQENQPVIAAWLAPKRQRVRTLLARLRPPAAIRGDPPPATGQTGAGGQVSWRAELPSFALVVVLGALLGSLLDPRFGASWTSLESVVAIAAAIVAAVAINGVVTGLCHRAGRQRPPVHLRAVPVGLVVAAVCVAVSRLVNFQPGYLYGVVCGVAFERRLTTRQNGRVTLAASAAVLLVAVVAWLAWHPVNAAATRPGAFPGVVVLDDFLASLTVGGLVGTTIGLLPLRFLPGTAIREWRPPVWVAAFGLALLLLVSIVVRSPLAPVSHSALWVIAMLFVCFAGVSVGFREYFSRRWRAEHGVAVHGLRDHVRDLLAARPVAPADEVQDRPPTGA